MLNRIRIEQTFPLWLYLIAILTAELIIAFLSIWIGLVCHVILFIYFIIFSVFIREQPNCDLILGLTLIPLIRIMSLAMPLANLPQIYWYPLIYLPLLAATIVLMRFLEIRPSQVGLIYRGLTWQIPLGILSGVAIGFAEYYILKPAPLISSLTFHQILIPALILITTTGLVEELIFRGVLQNLSLKAMGNWGLIYMSLIFAIMHIGFYSVLDMAFVFLIAMLFAFTVKKTGSLIGVTLSHGIANTILFTVAPFILG